MNKKILTAVALAAALVAGPTVSAMAETPVPSATPASTAELQSRVDKLGEKLKHAQDALARDEQVIAAIYAYMRHLGKKGEAMPAALEPGQAINTPVVHIMPVAPPAPPKKK